MASDEFGRFLDELIARTDIVSVVSGYVPLERKGKLYWARCPFHGEKTPSFIVDDISKSYHCFGCKAHGSVIRFVQEMETIGFMDAVNILAEKAGMQVPSFNGKINKDDIEAKKKYKDRLLALTKDAAKYYNENLFSGKCPEAWEYLKKRQVPEGLAKRFGLGASLGFEEVVKYLYSLGYKTQEMMDAGVVKCRNGRYYDAVAGRLIFPIIDVMGNVTGFCGRLLEKADFAKYLNTAETTLFSKGKTLYGINLVKKRKQDDVKNPIKYIIIVEGQMDVVSLHKAGFNTAVASMGTALTSDQARLIKRFTDNVIICYDGDYAGKKATIRGLEILKEEGLNIKVMSLPEGLDPDDVINKMGKEGFIDLMKKALPLLDFKLELVKKQFDLSNRDGRTKYISEALNVLREEPNAIEREVYLELVSEVSGTNKEFLKRQLMGLPPKQKNEESVALKFDKREKVQELDTALVKAQKFVLSCMINLKPFAYFERDIDYIFSGEGYIELCKAIESARGSVSTLQMVERCKEYLGGNFDEELSEVTNYVPAFGADESDAKYFKDSLWVIYKNYLDKKQEELANKLKTESDNENRKAILHELQEIVNIIKLKKVEL